jgi:hypothetical protein
MTVQEPVDGAEPYRSDWPIPTEDALQTEATENAHEKRSRSSSDYYLHSACCVLLGAIIFLVLFFVIVRNIIHNQKDDDNRAAGQAISPSTLPPSIVTDNRTMDAYRALLGIAEPEEGSPQHLALWWLASQDMPHILPLDDETDPWLQQRVEQRYALLVFYFAAGQYSGTGWATVSGARLHECLWPGTFCDEEDETWDVIVNGLELDPLIGVPQGPMVSELGMLSNLGTCMTEVTGEVASNKLSLTHTFSNECFILQIA